MTEQELNKLLEKVTRLEVIGITRELVKHNIALEVSIQDDGRTLKIFYGKELESKEEA